MEKAQHGWQHAKKIALREELYKVGVFLFKSNGYHETKVDHIINIVGVSKGTFFNYFSSKSVILGDYFMDLTLRVIHLVEAQNIKSAYDLALALVTELVNAVKGDPGLFQAMCEISMTNDHMKRHEQDLDGRMISLLSAAILADQKTGKIVAHLQATKFSEILIDQLTISARQCAIQGNLDGLQALVVEKFKLLFELAEGPNHG